MPITLVNKGFQVFYVLFDCSKWHYVLMSIIYKRCTFGSTNRNNPKNLKRKT